MKKKWIILSAIFLLFVLSACEFAGISIDFGFGGSDSDSGSAVLEAGVDSPLNGAALPMGPVDIAYHATSTDGVSAVELSIDGEVVSSFKSPESGQKVAALSYTWTPTGPGSHTIRVRAQSNTGAWSDFSAVTVSVQDEQPSQPEPEQEEEAPPPEPEEEEENGAPDTDEVTIYDIQRNKDIFYYGPGGCNREITITAKVANPEDVYVAVLFIKFIDKEGEGSTNWDSGRAMVKKSEGNYSITLFSESIPNWSLYEFAKMWYQIVLQDKAGGRMTASEVIKDLDFQICQ